MNGGRLIGTRLTIEVSKASHPGIVVFQKAVGEWVKAGEVIAEIINPLLTPGEERTKCLISSTDGLLFARSPDRHAHPGRILAKVAGKKALRGLGENLLTQ